MLQQSEVRPCFIGLTENSERWSKCPKATCRLVARTSRDRMSDQGAGCECLCLPPSSLFFILRMGVPSSSRRYLSCSIDRASMIE